MTSIEILVNDLNNRFQKVVGKSFFSSNEKIQSEQDLLEQIHKRWMILFLHPKGRILSFNWLKTHFSSLQLREARIYLSGTHKVNGDAVVGGRANIFHFGNGKIFAAGSSCVTDYGYAQIYAGDNTVVYAYNSNRIFVKGHSHVAIYTTRPKVKMWEKAILVADTYADIKSYGCAHITCKDGGHIIAKNNSFIDVCSRNNDGRVELYDKSIAVLHGETKAFVANEAMVKAYDDCVIEVEDNGVAIIHDNVKAAASCDSVIYATMRSNVTLSGSAINIIV